MVAAVVRAVGGTILSQLLPSGPLDSGINILITMVLCNNPGNAGRRQSMWLHLRYCRV